MSETRQFATPMPERIRRLPVDERGYPIPWFVDWVDGKPEFRAMDAAKFIRAIKEKRCWVCGETLGINIVFVAGPMCGINRTSSEPPSHLDCGRWSAINCPFLNNPQMVRREDDVIDNQKYRESSPGLPIARNPGVAMVWITRSFEVIKFPFKSPATHGSAGGNAGYLITMGEPYSVEWYASGRRATREEVLTSIETGLPNLIGLARMEKGGMDFLDKLKTRFEKWIPA